jgi:GNAT superfamily N-acetyltransferase
VKRYALRPVRGVRRAEEADAPAIARLLARAFFDDPVAAFLFPDRRGRPAMLDRFFDLQLRRNYLRRGVVYTTSDRDAAALWMPPGAPPPTLRERLDHFVFATRLGPRRRPAHRLTTLLEARHPGEPHWYLGAIGTEPSRQRHGLGTALLEEVLDICDETGVGAYLEASRADSARLYAHLGFERQELFDPGALGASGPLLHLMYRKGRPTRS